MEVLERDCSIIECGEEELDECQKAFYKSQRRDLDELVQFLLKANPVRGENGASADNASVSLPASSTLEDYLTQPPKPLVVLDPATLNQLATTNGYRASNVAGNQNPKSISHSLPAVAPSVRLPLQRSVTTTSAPLLEGMLTLSSLLNSGNQHPLQPRQGPCMRFPAPCPLQAAQVPSLPSPQVRIMPPRAQNVQLPAATVQYGQRTAPPPYPQVRVINPSSNTNGIAPPVGLDVNLPVPPKGVGSVLDQMQKRFSNPTQPEISDDRCTSTNKSALPPPDLPLLPETRPETASDSRPRARPGPVSRKQLLPSIQWSPDSRVSSDMVDLTQDDQPPPTATTPPTATKVPTKEKTFPSLIVTARASLKIFSTALVNNERLLMDNQIRKVMQMSPSVFTEYLLHQRLLKSEQFCKDHHKPLKLGIYSETHRFPGSGGYVWIADCCKSGFCSVYAGSIFDKTLQPPSNIIKLMYHWACNTAVHNVLNWVKVDSYVMKTYNTFFRAVCTAVVHEKFKLLGGAHKRIQVGVISIGTYPDGASKEVKVDIMAAMDPDIPSIRLKVLENFLSDSNKVYESKFRKILEVLKEWVHPDSTIITDFAVDMSLCLEYGFSNILMSGGRHAANNNNGVMDYLRAKIPVMFQNTLGLLSYTIIQQFLDELVWRETWGPFPSRAYDSLVEHIAEMTKLPGPDLITKLKKIASEPTKNWKYSTLMKERDPRRSGNLNTTKSDSKAKTTVPPIQENKKRETSVEMVPPVQETKKKESSVEMERPSDNTVPVLAESSTGNPSNSLDPAVAVPSVMIPLRLQQNGDRKIFLEPYYYGLVDGKRTRQKRSGAFLAECVLCKRDFLSASSFTNHLVHHALNDNSMLSRVSADKLLNVCSLCCKPVRDIDHHKKENHPYPTVSTYCYICKICRIDFKEEDKIIRHMTVVHQELEMPYKCDLCGFQTSVYESAAAHFKDFHDKDYCVRCPYCFKIVRFCTKTGLEITKNQYYFIQHVQKHSVSKLNRKCEKCVLSFTNMSTLKQHQERVHKRSGRVVNNVRRLKLENGKMLIMSLPIQAPLPPVTLNENSFHTLKGKALSSSVVVPEYYAVCSCLECDGPMTQNHFSVKMTCTRCSFQSCCANSIREHSARRHLVESSSEERMRNQIIGGSALLEKPLYCSYCPYSSSNGNKMAAHALDCGDGRASALSDKRKFEALDPPRKARKIL